MKYVLSVTISPSTYNYMQGGVIVHILGESKDVNKLNAYYTKVKDSIETQYPGRSIIFNIDTVMEEEDL